MRHDDDPLPRRPSSWSAAIAQLPGFPEEAKPKLPPIADGKDRRTPPSCGGHGVKPLADW